MLKDDDQRDDDQRISFRFAPCLAWTSLIHLSHGQSFIGDEEFVILVTFNRAKKDPLEAFRFLTKLTQKNAESESVSPNHRSTWLKNLLSRFP